MPQFASAPLLVAATKPSLDAIDTFVDALWLEEGLSKNTLAAYRQDLSLYAAWLTGQARQVLGGAEPDY